MKKRDSQKSKLYAAERRVFFAEDTMTLGECQDMVDDITQSVWWKRRSSFTYITVTPGKGGSTAYAHRIPPTIRLPRGWSRNEWVTLHELAHFLTPWQEAAHGSRFAATYVLLVKRYIGEREAIQLKEEFRKVGISCRGVVKPMTASSQNASLPTYQP